MVDSPDHDGVPPVSNSTQPNAQTSASFVDRLPRACSGDMYAAVPKITQTPEIGGGDVIAGSTDTSGDTGPVGSIAFASPKSATFTLPSDGSASPPGRATP